MSILARQSVNKWPNFGCHSPYKKFLASFLALLAWPWQSMICQQSQQILADFILAFLAFVGKKLYLPRIVGSTGGLLPSKSADLAIYLTQAYCQKISAHFCREMLAKLATFENNQFFGFYQGMLANLANYFLS